MKCNSRIIILSGFAFVVIRSFRFIKTKIYVYAAQDIGDLKLKLLWNNNRTGSHNSHNEM